MDYQAPPVIRQHKEAGRKYDIIIPLDHTRPENIYSVPDYRGGNTFRGARATGADGRERVHQDPAAVLLERELESRGLNVRVITPEEFGNYDDYDRFISLHSNSGTKVIPIHFDAKVGQGGVGFLTRVRRGDVGDRMLAGSIDAALREFQEDNPELGNYRTTDTVPNATVNAARFGPATLVEMGAMVQWESAYGEDFTETKKFHEFIDILADGIVKGAGIKLDLAPPTGWMPPVTEKKDSLKITEDWISWIPKNWSLFTW